MSHSQRADGPTAAEPGGRGRPPIGTRHVVLLATAVVVLVLGLQAVSMVIPEVGAAVGVLPLLIVALVVVTAIVLVGALRPRA